MNLHSYIQSGIVESYVLGLVTPEDKIEFEQLLPVHPELQRELEIVSRRVESLARQGAVPPPPETWQKVQDFIEGLPVLKHAPNQKQPHSNGNGHKALNGPIEAKVSSDHIRVHKLMKPAFILVFILSKIFLGLLIFYMIKFYRLQNEVEQLKSQIEILHKQADRAQ